MRRRSNKRCDDLHVALAQGHCSNGNHRITAGEGITHGEWCQTCEDSLRCFLAGKMIDVQEAVNKKRPCVQQAQFIYFYYHNALCLTFDKQRRRVNDWGYWGYSVTTSRSIRWYIEALAYHDFIPYDTVEPAITFFKKRNDTETWFQC
jgi:hypothetical protein